MGPISQASDLLPQKQSLLYIQVPKKLEILLQQSWFDPRLIHSGGGGGSSGESVPGGVSVSGRGVSGGVRHFLNGVHHLKDLWLPKPYIEGWKNEDDDGNDAANVALHIYGNGSTRHSIRSGDA